MRSEREIREKIESLDGQKFGNPKLDEDYCLQIDMLLWVLEDESGLPPLDEREKAVANICGDCNEGSEYKKETRL